MRTSFLSLVAAVAFAIPALAGDEAAPRPEAGPQHFDMSQVAAMMSSMAGEEKESKSPYPDFKEVTKDMKSDEGMFTLWYYPAGAKDKDSEKLLCQIPSALLGENFMLSTSFSGGGFFTGFPLDERVVKWEVLDRQLLLIEPETRFVVDQSKEIADVVRRTYPDRIRVAVPIVTKTPSGDPVIDLGHLLKSNFADIGWMVGGINSSLSRWTKKKVFPGNVEIGVELAVGSGGPPGSYDRKSVHYSFWKLPKTDYQPRVADDRVGYFLTTNRDWAKPTSSRDIFNRYIDRWHLEKRDPSLEKCEPKQPIVFYIEKTVPVRFRRAVRDGILEWNKAFEKIGFLHAVEVRQQTDDNEWKDLDPEDMRYSFFRWIVTGAGFAMGPHRANPFTGQIYDADIIFDDSMVRFFEQEADQMLPSAIVAEKFSDPALDSFVREFPQWKRPVSAWEQFVFGDKQDPDLRSLIRHRMEDRGCHLCEYVDGMKQQVAVARAVLEDQPKEVLDRFLYDVIRETVMHEVGHTLGLRHNFKASSVYTLDEIRKRRDSNEPTCGSVMDYNPVLFFSGPDAIKGHFVTPTIGPYDYWAIEYGYRPYDQHYKSPGADSEQQEKAKEQEEAPPGEKVAEAAGDAEEAADTPTIPKAVLEQIPPELLKKMPADVRKMLEEAATEPGKSKESEGKAFKAPVQGEEGMLKDIASRSTEPELAYATDEDTTFLSPDPRTNRFDMGADPINWARTRYEVIDNRLSNILDWAVKDQESWYHLRQVFQRLMFEKLQLLDYVGRYVGGKYFNRAHRGDPNSQPPFVVVAPEVQRKALSFIENQLYQDSFFRIPPDLLNHLAPARWWHEGMSVSYSMDFPVRDMISLFQWWNLFDRFYPGTLQRIFDAELQCTCQDRVTLAGYLKSLRDACWNDATDIDRLKDGSWTDASPFISDTRRSLQREYLGVVEPLVRLAPGSAVSPDIHAMLQYSLRTLSDDLDLAIAEKKADFASQAHLVACKSRIDRMLAPQLQEYGF